MSNTHGQQPPGGYPPPGPGAAGPGGYGSPGSGPGGSGPGDYAPPGNYPPPGSYAPPAKPRSRRRWLVWYGLGVLLLVAGVVSIVLGVSSFSGAVNSLARVPLPPGGTVTLNHAGSNIIYYESSTGAAAAQSSISIRIVPASPGAKVTDLRTYGSGSSSTYTLNGRHGVAVFTVQVVHPGRFTVAASSPGGALNGGRLAIGGSVAGHLLVGLLLGILLILAGLAVLVVTTIVLVIKRIRARPSPQPGYPQPGQV